ncbi:MAG TPA: hypothetical protein VFR71_03200 [Methyloceanibacter sp.]|nr:hypothetical protein [Methyloceanibacter sp.]
MNLDSDSGPKALRDSCDGHAVILDPIIGLSRLEPASASVPAAAKNQQNEDDDDEKCGVVHVALLALELVIDTQSLAGKARSGPAQTRLLRKVLREAPLETKRGKRQYQNPQRPF